MPTPLNQEGTYEGISLGLGTTAAHLLIAPKIKRKGSVVMASIGASVQNQISEKFIERLPELTNPNFKFVNLAQPAKDIDDWLVDSSVWDTVTSRLSAAGLTYYDIQVIWLQDDLINLDPSVFPTSPTEVKDAYKDLIVLLKSKFPKLKQIFMSARPYSGFTTDIKHDEPKGYHNGWACKWVVEDQIAGLMPASPWICDSIYMWTDGTNPREDGFSILESNYNADGIHLSNSGKIKFSDYLFDQLLIHPVSSKYFY